jgi:hypothetical protein
LRGGQTFENFDETRANYPFFNADTTPHNHSIASDTTQHSFEAFDDA